MRYKHSHLSRWKMSMWLPSVSALQFNLWYVDIISIEWFSTRTFSSSSLDLNPRVSYEGGRCLDNAHCVDNMRCSAEKCVCLQDFHAQNGLCCKEIQWIRETAISSPPLHVVLDKKLNSTCDNDNQCWSNYCINSRCDCPVGYETNTDGVGCRKISLYIRSRQ